MGDDLGEVWLVEGGHGRQCEELMQVGEKVGCEERSKQECDAGDICSSEASTLHLARKAVRCETRREDKSERSRTGGGGQNEAGRSICSSEASTLHLARKAVR